jgi:hypothetical protein
VAVAQLETLGVIRTRTMKHILMWLRRRKWLLLCCGAVLLLFVGSCAFLRISNVSDVLAYYGMFRNYHPMVRDLAFRQINRGESLSDLLQRYPTNGPATYGHFSICGGDNLCWRNPSNHTSVEVIARNGKLIFAKAWGSVNGTPWDFTFFHTTNDAEMLHQVDQEAEATFRAHENRKNQTQ